MKILNLFSGIGGNRKLWGDDHDITAVEFDPEIARAYQDRFPNDTVIVGDAMQYLLDHYKEYDFIWASPPCQTHSRVRMSQKNREAFKAKFFDPMLWQVIIFLQNHTLKGGFVVENVIPFYKPFVEPTAKLKRHLYWSNFEIEDKDFETKYKIIRTLNEHLDFDLSKYKVKNRRQIIRNQVDENIGKHILDCYIKTQGEDYVE